MDEKFRELLARPTLSIDNAAVVLGVSQSSLYALARGGKVKSIRVGGRVLIPTAGLREMLGIAA